ncbi:MAG: YfhO family protein, partial [Lewinella sp.]|nr:YfhO family protein [Lewinella sp.]
FIFEHVPLYNKFRTPNSVLSVAAILVPTLGFLAVNRIIKGEVSTQEVMRSLMISGGILGGICLFFLLLGPSMFDFTHPTDPQRAQNFRPDLLISMRKSLMRSDSLRSLILIGLSAAGIWAFIQNKLDKKWLMLGLGVLVLFDMWGVGRRYINEDSFYPKRTIESSHNPRPVDTQILQDKSLDFRVLDLTVNPFESTQTSYYHKSIGGYHAAKLQRYQDIIEHHIQAGNQAILDMLNTKYFIQPGPDNQAAAVVNPGALGNAWFVSDIEMVPNANAEIDALTDFDPAQTAVVHDEFQNYVSGLSPDGTGTIELTEYAPDKLTYKSNSSSEQLAVFSEVWYGPHKGWQAYIDGEPVEHIRVDYLLRALRLPSGQHTIVFEFSPDIYKAGVAISLVSSLIIILGILGIAGYYGYQFYRKMQEEPVVETPQKTTVKKTVAKTKRKKK